MENDNLELVDRVCRQARAALEGARRRTSEEIHSYPSPIAGCDAQFNHLLEQRTGIAAELQRLATLNEGHPGAQELDAFLASSAHLDEQTRQALRKSLKPQLAKVLESASRR